MNDKEKNVPVIDDGKADKMAAEAALKKAAAAKKAAKVAAEIHQLVGRVHRLKILMGRQANPDTHDRYQKEFDEKEAALNKLSAKHHKLINKELAALDYVPK